MPVMIEEMLTSLDVQDQEKLRELIRKEIEAALEMRGPGRKSGSGLDPADPGAGSKPSHMGR
jgi:hypothetical protein